MKAGKTNTWKGRLQPKRDRCPKCGKRGLGPMRYITHPLVVGQTCRYCGHIKRPIDVDGHYVSTVAEAVNGQRETKMLKEKESTND